MLCIIVKVRRYDHQSTPRRLMSRRIARSEKTTESGTDDARRATTLNETQPLTQLTRMISKLLVSCYTLSCPRCYRVARPGDFQLLAFVDSPGFRHVYIEA
jgi:hypothetical protein